MSISTLSAFGGHFPAHGDREKTSGVRGLGPESATGGNPEVGFCFFRKAAGIFQATDSMNVASATSFSERPPASCVESTISTLL
jgi:hypothetical protein